jgi:hypothetical protein
MWAELETAGEAEVSQILAVGCSMPVSGNMTAALGTAIGNTAVLLGTAGGRPGCGGQGLVDQGCCNTEGGRDGSVALATCSTGQVLARRPRLVPVEGAGSATTPTGRGLPLSLPHCAFGRWGFPHRAIVLRCAPGRVGFPLDPAA